MTEDEADEEFERLTNDFMNALAKVDVSRESYEAACRGAAEQLLMECS